MATLTIKHGARPRYLPKKITNYTYVERENKRIYNYKYTEDEASTELWREQYSSLFHAIKNLDDVLEVDCEMIMYEGDKPKQPVWEFQYYSHVYNQGTVYEFTIEEIIQAILRFNGQAVKIIRFNMGQNIIGYARGRHDAADGFTMGVYEYEHGSGDYNSWVKVIGRRGTLHTWWVKQELYTQIIDNKEIFFLGDTTVHEEHTGDNGNPVIGTPTVNAVPKFHIAYNCEVKLELEED